MRVLIKVRPLGGTDVEVVASVGNARYQVTERMAVTMPSYVEKAKEICGRNLIERGLHEQFIRFDPATGGLYVNDEEMLHRYFGTSLYKGTYDDYLSDAAVGFGVKQDKEHKGA